MKTFSLCAFLVAMLGITPVADAVTGDYSINGASCVPGDPAIQNNRHFITAGSVSHQSTTTGLITLYCPVFHNWTTNPTFLSLTYRDTDGAGTVANITAQLLRLNQTNGAFSTVSGVLDSNGFTATFGRQIVISFTHNFDFTANVYYIRVNINRSATTQIATFYGLSLFK